ncbi:MAG: RnfABCDGE type electron transport complex subunit D [Clostridia bacterium]|nr:RnfABCDGE type electron transport complex subunit D [Clostridia bacterium]
MSLLSVSSSPHIRTSRTTASVMRDVLIALVPALLAGVLFFGWRSLAVVGVTIGFAVLTEALFCIVTKRAQTIGDLSAAVTGLLLGLNLPSTMPLWQAALGSIVAILVVKCLFGGIGCNFANPAVVGRIVLFIAFTASMNAPNMFFDSALDVDMVAGATPLSRLNEGFEPYQTVGEFFFGNYGGMIGETCAIALLLGGAYLLARKVITYHIPVAYLGTVALFALCAGRPVVAELLSGGLLLGAFFMATDYVTSPHTPWGKVIFGVGCGLVTMFIRVFCAYPEGVSFAILLMNILCPYIEKWTARRPVGGVDHE